MIPTQIRAVDPFSSYHSNNVNKLMRLILGSKAGAIAADSMLFVSKLSDTELFVTKGFCAKDRDITSSDDCPVVIQIVNDVTFDITDEDNYIIRTVGEPKNMELLTVAYLVLTYQYQKLPDPPQAYIKLLKHIDDFDPMYHLFLAKINFSSTFVIDTVEQTDGVIERQILNLYETYNDTKARAADSINPITNHLTDLSNTDTVVTLNSSGVPTLVSKADAGFYHNVAKIASDYIAGSPYNILRITHNLGHYPMVQVIWDDISEVIEPVKIKHNSINQFDLAFDAAVDGGTPDVHVLYI
jgi:hypothetical protein